MTLQHLHIRLQKTDYSAILRILNDHLFFLSNKPFNIFLKFVYLLNKLLIYYWFFKVHWHFIRNLYWDLNNSLSFNWFLYQFFFLNIHWFINIDRFLQIYWLLNNFWDLIGFTIFLELPICSLKLLFKLNYPFFIGRYLLWKSRVLFINLNNLLRSWHILGHLYFNLNRFLYNNFFDNLIWQLIFNLLNLFLFVFNLPFQQIYLHPQLIILSIQL